MRRSPNWSWSGAIVLSLAILVGGGWATALVMSASSRTPPITDNTGDLLLAVGGMLAGSISAYIGAQAGSRRRGEEEDPEGEDPEDPRSEP